MEDSLIQLLGGLGYPVIQQGTLAPDEKYPDHFFTFWNNDSSDHAHYDNVEFGTAWNYSINFYSVDPEKTYSVLAKAKKELKKFGWIISGKGYDVASDEITHTGRGMDAYFLEID